MKLKKVVKLPQYLRQLAKNVGVLQQQVGDLRAAEHYIREQQAETTQRLAELQEELKNTANKLGGRLDELEHVITVTARTNTQAPAEAVAANKEGRFADNHLLDQFYLELENNLRGSEDEIKQKQKPYLPLFKKTKLSYQKYPVVDLGSGRGEFLDLLKENDVRGIGVDLNETMVKRMQDKGIEAVFKDAIEYLLEAKSNSLGGVVGFHIAEHLPFEQLMQLIAEAKRTLVNGGFLLLETPNPENISVGAFTFHYDPSHLKPLPPALLEFMAAFKGFSRTEILRLQPEFSDKEIAAVSKNSILQTSLHRLHGPRDYALIAYK